jgi:hypothetical protein
MELRCGPLHVDIGPPGGVRVPRPRMTRALLSLILDTSSDGGDDNFQNVLIVCSKCSSYRYMKYQIISTCTSMKIFLVILVGTVYKIQTP